MHFCSETVKRFHYFLKTFSVYVCVAMYIFIDFDRLISTGK